MRVCARTRVCARCACSSRGGHRAPGRKEGRFLVAAPAPPLLPQPHRLPQGEEQVPTSPALRPAHSRGTIALRRTDGPFLEADSTHMGRSETERVVSSQQACGIKGARQGLWPACMGWAGAMRLGHIACLSWLSAQAPGTHQPGQISLQTRYTLSICTQVHR